MVNRERTTGYLPTLDGWRALAILGVIFYHGLTTVFYPTGPYPSYEALKLVQVGHRGVDVFFAISGFLICSRLIQERQKTGGIDIVGFYIRRFFRILPPFWVYLLAIAGLTSSGLIFVERREFLGALCFVRNYVSPTQGHGWYTGHIWSLSVEEHFYLLLPPVLMALSIRSARTAVFTAVLTISGVLYAMHLRGWSQFGSGNATHLRIDGLLWGCWSALILANPRSEAFLKRRLGPLVWLGMALLVAAAVRCEFAIERYLEAFVFPWLIVGTVLNPGWRISRFLESSVMTWIGRLSYSLYLWQQLWMFGRFTVERPFDLGPLQELPINLVCTLACAIASYYLVERPSLSLGRRVLGTLNRWRSDSPASSVLDNQHSVTVDDTASVIPPLTT